MGAGLALAVTSPSQGQLFFVTCAGWARSQTQKVPGTAGRCDVSLDAAPPQFLSPKLGLALLWVFLALCSSELGLVIIKPLPPFPPATPGECGSGRAGKARTKGQPGPALPLQTQMQQLLCRSGSGFMGRSHLQRHRTRRGCGSVSFDASSILPQAAAAIPNTAPASRTLNLGFSDLPGVGSSLACA